MSKRTQTERVYDYMLEFGSITPLDALRDLGCMRLGARVWELRNRGIPVVSDMIGVKNRWGDTVRVAQYSLPRGLMPKTSVEAQIVG